MQFEYGDNDRLLDIRDEMHKYGNVVYMLLPCHAQLDWASPSRENPVKILFYSGMPEFRRNNRSTRDRFNRGNSRPNRNNDRRDSSREPRGECLTLRIEKMVQGGEGIARLEDDRLCFVV